LFLAVVLRENTNYRYAVFKVPASSRSPSRKTTSSPPGRRRAGGSGAVAPAPVSQNSTAWALPESNANRPAVCQALGAECRYRFQAGPRVDAAVRPERARGACVLGTACGGQVPPHP
jgi:hypothetical protein